MATLGATVSTSKPVTPVVAALPAPSAAVTVAVCAPSASPFAGHVQVVPVTVAETAAPPPRR